MNILEVFSGSESFSKIARDRNHNTFTSDINDFGTTDYVCNVLEFDVYKVPFVPDVCWFSCPCQGFSVASIGKNWNHNNTPKTDKARLGVEMVKKTKEIINHFCRINPNLIWVIENPRGKLRKLDLLPSDKINTITYCQYTSGDELPRMKPTDIWTNLPNWHPRKMCKNGDSCHVSAPRGSRTGTQGLKGNFERSKVPSELCREILIASEKNYYQKEI